MEINEKSNHIWIERVKSNFKPIEEESQNILKIAGYLLAVKLGSYFCKIINKYTKEDNMLGGPFYKSKSGKEVPKPGTNKQPKTFKFSNVLGHFPDGIEVIPNQYTLSEQREKISKLTEEIDTLKEELEKSKDELNSYLEKEKRSKFMEAWKESTGKEFEDISKLEVELDLNELNDWTTFEAISKNQWPNMNKIEIYKHSVTEERKDSKNSEINDRNRKLLNFMKTNSPDKIKDFRIYDDEKKHCFSEFEEGILSIAPKVTETIVLDGFEIGGKQLK